MNLHAKLAILFASPLIVSGCIETGDSGGGKSITVERTVLNDTGIDWGGNSPNGNNSTCTGETIASQDCSHGRDIQASSGSLAKAGDGAGGFDFSKIDAAGNVLPDYATNWTCVKDNHTGLVWEVKVDAPQGTNLHSNQDKYTWYNTKNSRNGGADGSRDNGNITCYGYSSSEKSSFCNTQDYANRVNEAGLCGAKDWRLPTLSELQSIAHLGVSSPAIDTNYFPNSMSAFYWSSSPHANSSNDSWGIGFILGNSEDSHRYSSGYVRLVRQNSN